MRLFDDQKKQEIAEMLDKYCDRYGSRNSASMSLKNVSASTISSVLNGKWENIADAMWKSIRDQVGGTTRDWELVSTPTLEDIHFVLQNAQEDRNTIWLTAPAGSGKTATAQLYREQNRNVIYVLCDEDMKKSSFAIELARAAGMRINTQRSARDKIMQVIDWIGEMEDPLIIFDEGDKLTDNILYYFITFYNRLSDKAGIVFLSTNYMQKRMDNGLIRNHKGYQELSSRIGRKFYEAEVPSANDVSAICRANGIDDDKLIASVVKDASGCDFDLRRVERKVKALRKKLQTMNK